MKDARYTGVKKDEYGSPYSLLSDDTNVRKSMVLLRNCVEFINTFVVITYLPFVFVMKAFVL